MATDTSPGPRSEPRGRGRWGIRQLLTLATAVIVALSLLGAIIVLSLLIQRTLLASAHNGIIDETSRLVALVQAQGPEVIEFSQEVSEDYRAQVWDSHGKLVSTSNPRIRGQLTTARPPLGAPVALAVATNLWSPRDADNRSLFAAQTFDDGDQVYTLLVSTSLTGQRDAAATTVSLLFASLPVVIALSAVAAYLLLGRALRPIERITRRVERITARNLTERVPVPPSGDEVAKLATTMNSMLARLEASTAAQTRFVSDASHELRSPLTTLSGALQLAESSGDPAVAAELVPLMRSETERLQHLVGNLLLLSRSDDRGIPLVLADVDVDDLIDAETKRLRASSTLDVRRDVKATRVVGDRDKLLHLLRNLSDNARRHAHSVVLLAVEPTPAGGARIEVADDGSGVPVEARATIFDRFVRLDDSRSRDSGGSGLGLAIVAEVAHAHGGTVWVEESTLGGAAFIVDLPAAPPTDSSA